MTKSSGQSSLVESSWVLLMFVAAMTAPPPSLPKLDLDSAGGPETLALLDQR